MSMSIGIQFFFFFFFFWGGGNDVVLNVVSHEFRIVLIGVASGNDKLSRNVH